MVRHMHKLFTFITVITLSNILFSPTSNAKPGYDPLITGSGKPLRIVKQLPNIQTVTVHGAVDLYIQQISHQNANELFLEAEDNIISSLTQNTTAGNLELSSKYSSLRPNTRPKYTLRVKHVHSIVADGTVKIICKTGINQNMLHINLQQNASGDIWFNGDKLNATLWHTANLIIGGNSSHQHLDLHGHSHFDGTALQGYKGTVNILNAGVAVVNIHDTLTLHLAAASEVFYIGQPKINANAANGATISELQR